MENYIRTVYINHNKPKPPNWMMGKALNDLLQPLLPTTYTRKTIQIEVITWFNPDWLGYRTNFYTHIAKDK